MEQWKDIPGYEGLYQASTLGRIKSLRFGKEKILKPSLDSGGYLRVNLRKNKKSKLFRIHQLVAITFLGHIPCGLNLVVDHINSNKLENYLENLTILTSRENSSKEKFQKNKLPIGVDKLKNKFRSRIKIKGKVIHLGFFSTPEEASEAYQQYLRPSLEF